MRQLVQHDRPVGEETYHLGEQVGGLLSNDATTQQHSFWQGQPQTTQALVMTAEEGVEKLLV